MPETKLDVVLEQAGTWGNDIAIGVSGLLYPYGDAAACAAAIRRLMDDPALGERLADTAAASIGQYSLEQVFPQVMAAYESVTERPVAAGERA